MKTWMNPEIEELDVKLTANGDDATEWEDTGDVVGDIVDSMGGNGELADEIVDSFIPDYDIINDGKKDKKQS